MKSKYFVMLLGILFCARLATAERWPMGAGDAVRPIGNYYSQFLDFGGGPYYHDGIDLMGAAGDPVYSVSGGFIREIQVADPNYSGMFITYNAAGQDLGWCYWHITSTTMPFIEGDEVHVGDYLGDISNWPWAAFHHLHFTRSRYPGNGGAWYDAVANPIEFLVPSAEPDAPVFQEAEPGRMFSLVENNTDNPIDPAAVHGQVDIIARISDRILDAAWIVIPYRIEWWVENMSSVVVVPARDFVVETGDCFDDATVTSVVYKDSGIWNTSANYDAASRVFYFVVTNSDGDGRAEPTDRLFAFASNSLANGDYRLFVRAYDWAGNATVEHMDITVNNATGENSLDIVQVLDRTGSMSEYAGETSTDRKIEVLRYAADEFIQMMKSGAGNRLGIVQFNQDVVPFPPPDPGLKELTADNVPDFRGSVASIVNGGTTSIGDGLHEADGQLSGVADPNPIRAILLISDGMENTPSWIAERQPDLIAHGIKVYALGLGYGSGIDQVRLADLAEATGGDFRITSVDLEFRKFFLEVLADAANWEVIVDPVRTLGSTPDQIPVPVTEYDRKVILTAYWEGSNADNGAALTLVSPSGKTVSPAVKDAHIKYASHPRYAFYELTFPLGGEFAGDHQGVWMMRLAKAPNAGEIRYGVSAFTDSAVEFDVQFSTQASGTGETVMILGRLSKGGIPIPGLRISVYGDVPRAWAGNLLHAAAISPDALDPKRTVGGDPVGLAEQKIALLSKRSERNVLVRGSAPLTLYDDGLHQDGKAGDGIYAASFANTKVPGSYTFRFVALGIPAGGGQTTSREWTKSFFNKVKIDPDSSVILRTPLSLGAGRVGYRVRVAPRDRYGNYLGPGHLVKAIVWYAGRGRDVALTDQINGDYTGDIELSGEEIREKADILIEVDGRAFQSRTAPSAGDRMASLHGGWTMPSGAFGRDYDPGPYLYCDLGYRLDAKWAFVLNAGIAGFKAAHRQTDDLNWVFLSGNARYRLLSRGRVSLDIGGGPGLYFSKGNDAKFGVNAGLSAQYAMTGPLSLECGADWHVVFKGMAACDPAGSGDAAFGAVRVGLILNL